MDPDSEYLYDRMREATYTALRATRGARVLDSAAGLGHDGQNLAERGLWVTNVEPSQAMHDLVPLIAEKQGWKDWGAQNGRARAWSEVLPFRRGAFDASFCKGSIDHFPDPVAAIAEMARVTRRDGRVVVAVANFDSLACKLLRLRDRLRGGSRGAKRRHYHVPSDHFTRFDLALIREQMKPYVEVDEITGVCTLWGLPSWANLLKALPESACKILLRAADQLARLRPGLADIVVLAGHPR